MHERQLEWVRKNLSARGGSRRTAAIGEVADRIITAHGSSMPSWRRRVLKVLAEHAGPELLDLVSPVSLRDGVLTLAATEPAATYRLRLEWEQRLLRLLQTQVPAAGIVAVRFVAGRVN